MELVATALLVVGQTVAARVVVVDFAGRIVARECAVLARKFRQRAQPMTNLNKL
jgi:hypothetical protein